MTTNQTITFTQRSGAKRTVRIIADIGHAIEAEVLKGLNKGRVMVFAKHDIAIVN
jgi:hypothetical protein